MTFGGDGGEREVEAGDWSGVWGVGVGRALFLSRCSFPPWLADCRQQLSDPAAGSAQCVVPCSSSSHGSSVLQQDLEVPCLPCREPPQPWIVHVLGCWCLSPWETLGHADFPFETLCPDLAVLPRRRSPGSCLVKLNSFRGREGGMLNKRLLHLGVC